MIPYNQNPTGVRQLAGYRGVGDGWKSAEALAPPAMARVESSHTLLSITVAASVAIHDHTRIAVGPIRTTFDVARQNSMARDTLKHREQGGRRMGRPSGSRQEGSSNGSSGGNERVGG